MAAVAVGVFLVFAVLPVLVVPASAAPHVAPAAAASRSTSARWSSGPHRRGRAHLRSSDQFSDIPRQEFAPGRARRARRGRRAPRTSCSSASTTSEGLDAERPGASSGATASSLLTDTIMILRVDPDTEEAHAPLVPPRPVGPDRRAQRQRHASTTALPVRRPRAADQDHQGQLRHHDQPLRRRSNFAGLQGARVDPSTACRSTSPTRPATASSGLNIQVDEAGLRHRSTPDRPSPSSAPAPTTRSYVDGEWEPDATSDLGRIRRQQYFIQLALDAGHRQGRPQPDRPCPSSSSVGQEHVVLDEALTARRPHRPRRAVQRLRPRRAAGPYQLAGHRRQRRAAASVLFLNEDEAAADLRPCSGAERRAGHDALRRSGSRSATARASPARPSRSQQDLHAGAASPSPALGRRRRLPTTTRPSIRYAPGQRAARPSCLARYLDGEPASSRRSTSLGDANRRAGHRPRLHARHPSTSRRSRGAPTSADASTAPHHRRPTTPTTQHPPEPSDARRPDDHGALTMPERRRGRPDLTGPVASGPSAARVASAAPVAGSRG